MAAVYYGRIGHLFPYLPQQPGYHKRFKAAAPLLGAAIDHLARYCPSWHAPVRLIDATPVPCGPLGRRSGAPSWPDRRTMATVQHIRVGYGA